MRLGPLTVPRLAAALLLAWCAAAYAWGALQENARSGVVALQDGRMIAIRGDIEILGDEVQFVDGNGELMSLPLERIDMEKTRSLNARLRGEETPAGSSESDDSLFDQVQEFKRRGGDGRGEPTGTFVDDPGSESGTEDEPEPPPEEEPVAGDGFLTDYRMDDFDAKAAYESFRQWLDQIEGRALAGVIAFLALLLISSLASFITQIYVIVRSFRDGPGWGLSLLLTFIGPSALSIAYSVFPFAPAFAVGLASLIGSLLFLLLFVLYISLHCYGMRLKLFLLWLSPVLVLILARLAAGYLP